MFFLLFPALSPGAYAGQGQGAYGKTFKDAVASEVTDDNMSLLADIHCNKHQLMEMLEGIRSGCI